MTVPVHAIMCYAALVTVGVAYLLGTWRPGPCVEGNASAGVVSMRTT